MSPNRKRQVARVTIWLVVALTPFLIAARVWVKSR